MSKRKIAVPEDALDTVMKFVRDDPALDATIDHPNSPIVQAIIEINDHRGVEWDERSQWRNGD